jgi:phosphatidylserine/phosphatidylglycerophosphate/cardiolipin synthase-like enzyme
LRKLAALFALCCCAAQAFEAPAAPATLAAAGSAEVLFSPWDDVEGHLIAALDGARQSIHVQAYLLTSRNIAKALLQAQQRGVQVQILADAEMSKGESSQIPKLAAAGIPVWLETRYANAHNKIMLIDAESRNPAVITGSYNYTWSAQARNAENLLILRDNSQLTKTYLHNWRRHQRDAEPYRETQRETPSSGK